MRKRSRDAPTVEALKSNPDGLLTVVIDIYKELGELRDRVGSLEGTQKVTVALLIATVVSLIALFLRGG